MIEVTYTNGKGTSTCLLPENYNELSGKQVIDICKLFFSSIPLSVARVEALRILLKKNPYSFFRITIEAKAGLLEYIDWVFEKNGLTNQFLPVYRPMYGLKGTFYGPASDWDNLIMAEWSACEVYYEWMISGEKDDALDHLIAVLYRKGKKGYDKAKDPDGDIRVPYNHHETGYWAKQIAKWPMALKMGILMWYDGCREMMINTYDVFDSGSAPSDVKAPGMFELIRGLCGNRYGSFDAVEQMNVHKALREMELLKAEAAKLPK